ncbi:MAG TPA: hypothetical protein EYP04_03775, partial [Anaerolineae bacterium]|nr:hypothetical protein [Anaerolineae bacterium]
MERIHHVYIWRNRRRRLQHYGPKPWQVLVRLLVATVLLAVLFSGLVILAGVGTVAGVYAYYAKELPNAQAIETEQEQFETVKIYDRTGQHLLYEVIDPRPYRGDRTYVPLSQISPYLISATIALEDRNFYTNPGVNFEGIARAFVSNLRGGS